MRIGLRSRLALTHAAVAVVAILVVGVIANVAVSRRFDQYVSDQQGQRDLALVAQLADAYATTGGWDQQAVFTARRLAMADGVGLRVYDATGTFLFAAGRGAGMMGQGMMGGQGQGVMGGQGAGAASPEGAQAASPSASDSVSRYPITVNGQNVASVEVVNPAAATLPQDVAYRRALNWYLLLAALVAGALAVAISVLVSRRIARPVVALTDASEELARGSLDVRVPAGGGDEIGELAGAFNRMAAALARNEEWRRSMTADLAHELRTPLATIQTRVEALEDGVLPATPENLRVIGEEVERLARLLGELRSLSEADAEGFTVSREPLDLGVVAGEAAKAAEAGFVRKGVELTVAAQAVAVVADRDRLRQVTANLLDNALKFTPQGGHVHLTTGADDGRAVLRVSDDGPGIPEAELPYVFERFYRAETARRTHGAGLGLAIAERLVKAQGGEIEAANGEQGGAVLTVRLPVARFAAPSRDT